MIALSPQRIAQEAGAEIVRPGEDAPPRRAVIDSRQVEPGDLFVGLKGEHADGGEFAAAALDAGAWGAIVAGARADALASGPRGWVLAAADPLRSLQRLARAWRRELDCPTVGITGSTGKTSTKDICRALLAERVHASPENYNTEVGLPLAVLDAPAGTAVLVLEMAMRGPGQIAELCEVAEPDIALITNVGPVHLELLGSVEAVAAAKAEILVELREGGAAVVPSGADVLEPHIDAGLRTLRFGTGGDVYASQSIAADGSLDATIVSPAGEQDFRFPFSEAHNLENALAAVAVGVALGVPLAEMARRAPRIVFSRLRGELIDLGDGIVLINDSYNANPMSMRAALDHLGGRQAGRRIAVLGEMKELGPAAESYHREIGVHARECGVDLVVGVGGLAGAYSPDRHVRDAAAAAAEVAALLEPGDAVLIKGSRSVGLELVAEELRSGRPRAAGAPGERAGNESPG